jgi:hypothetical protein
MSQDKKSSQSFAEFSGLQMKNDNATGCGTIVPTTGSLLVLSPAQLSLPSFLSSGSVGNFNFQFQISVTNFYSDSQYPNGIQPEICIICANSGKIKEMVLNAQEKKHEAIIIPANTD